MIESAYLIVTKFESLYQQFAAEPRMHLRSGAKYRVEKRVYAVPVFGTNPDSVFVRYRGLDRDPLKAYSESDVAAEIRMVEIKMIKGSDDILIDDSSFILNSRHLADVFSWLESEKPDQYEPVWARVACSSEPPPPSFSSVGFEPSSFPNGFFSAVCDCMCFPRWHGYDKDGLLFVPFFNLLNRYGMFASFETAALFLDHYLSFEWTEHNAEYNIVEVFMKDFTEGG